MPHNEVHQQNLTAPVTNDMHCNPIKTLNLNYLHLTNVRRNYISPLGLHLYKYF